MLKRGGSAVDAAVAAQAVLDLVEPQSLGLGGGFFTVVYDSATKSVTAYHGAIWLLPRRHPSSFMRWQAPAAPAGGAPRTLDRARGRRRCRSADARPREGQAQMH